MKIAIFTECFLPKVDGVVTATLNLAKGLADRGHSVLIIAPKASGPEFKYKNIEVIRLLSTPSPFYKELKVSPFVSPNLVRRIRSWKPDVYHFQVPLTLSIHATLLAKLFRKPLVGTFHTFFADPAYLKHGKADYKFVEKMVWRYTIFQYAPCDIVTAPAEYTRKDLVAHGLKNKTVVISNGIDFSVFDNSKSSVIRKKYGRNILLFVGRIAHEKNLYVLLGAFKKLKSDAKLLIVGDGPQRRDIQKFLKKTRLKNVFLLGKMSHNVLVKSGLYGAAKLFVTASVTENQPMTLLEAQANGVVCIGPRAKGIPELIFHNKNGLLVKPNDSVSLSVAIDDLLQNESRRLKMQKDTLSRIKQHDLPAVIDKWEELYRSLL